LADFAVKNVEFGAKNGHTVLPRFGDRRLEDYLRTRWRREAPG
jgi:hypothetical protein